MQKAYKSPLEIPLVETTIKQVASKFRERSISSSRKSATSVRETKPSKDSVSNLNQLLMVNPDCYIQLLIEYIYEQIKLDVNIKFDLCDENGVLLEIFKLKPHESALKLLQNRQTYVVVVYEKDENDIIKSIEPLIYRVTKQDIDFYTKFLKNLSSTISKSSSSIKKGLKSQGSLTSKKSKSASKTGYKKHRSNTSQRSRKSMKS